ncbi:hypothetical protein H5410_041357 [Solanum commersonii]|uniref:Saposin-like type B region 1 domain-containing protein n=1 Tax=Solanum commersonii TaxID=4109 RepID=A0A9J5XRC8_SOLCO|nr:hypothetical protein H5410_041357 [Solanum commersonii]
MYLEKFKKLESRLSLQEQEAVKYRAADVSVIQKMLEDLTTEDDDVVQVNGKAFAIDRHLQQKQLSPPTAPSFHSTAYANGNRSAKSTDEVSNATSVPLEVQIDIPFGVSPKGPYEFLQFCVLQCSGRKQKKRTKDRKDFECRKCNQKTALLPRYYTFHFHGTATTTTSISAELGEKLLSVIAEDIFDITCAKNRSAGLHDHMCFACQIAIIWMDNQLTESKTEDRILHYLNENGSVGLHHHMCFACEIAVIWMENQLR